MVRFDNRFGEVWRIDGSRLCPRGVCCERTRPVRVLYNLTTVEQCNYNYNMYVSQTDWSCMEGLDGDLFVTDGAWLGGSGVLCSRSGANRHRGRQETRPSAKNITNIRSEVADVE